MKRVAALGAIGAAFAPRLAASQSAPTTIRLVSPAVDSVANALYAMHSGMFARAGLDVQFTAMPNGGAGAAAVAGGSAEVGYQNVLSTESAYLRGIPFRIICAGQVYSSKSPDPVLIVRKDSPLRTARDLDGKTIATSTLHDLGSTGLEVWINKNGGDSSTIKLIEMPYSTMAAAVDEGRVAAATVLAPASTEALNSGNFRVFAAFFDAVAPTFMLSAWYASASWIASHQDAALHFSRVMREAAIYANAHRDETAPLVAELTKVDLATVRSGVRSVFAEKLDLAQLQAVTDLMAKYKVLDRTFDVHEIVPPGDCRDLALTREANPRRRKRPSYEVGEIETRYPKRRVND